MFLSKETARITYTFRDRDNAVYDPDEVIVLVVSPTIALLDLEIGNVVGSAADFATTRTKIGAFLETGDLLFLTGSAYSANNGVWVVDSITDDFTVSVSKDDLEVLIAESSTGFRLSVSRSYEYAPPDPIIQREAEGTYHAYLPLYVAGKWKAEATGRTVFAGPPTRVDDNSHQVVFNVKDSASFELDPG